MPNDEIKIPQELSDDVTTADHDDATMADHDSDDDIVDLLEVIKPGKVSEQPAHVHDSPSDHAEFSADLDAMLARLADAESALDASDSHEQEEKEDDTPFPDPTPVDHVVDANETLNMPNMQDFDDLLETLGAKKEEPAKGEATPSHEQPLQDEHSDLDALPITESGTDTLAPLEPASSSLDDTDEQEEKLPDHTEGIREQHQDGPAVNDSIAAQPFAPVDLEDLPMPGPRVEPIASEQEIEPPLPVSAESPSAKDSSMAPNQYEEVDLNELDALLDDMLAKAPPSGDSAPKEVIGAEADEDDTPHTPEQLSGSKLPVEEKNEEILHALFLAQEEIKQVSTDLDLLKNAIENQNSQTPAGPQLDEVMADISRHKEHIEKQEESILEYKKLFEAQDALIKKQAQLLEEQGIKLDKLQEEHTDLRNNMEKFAAEAAAKVIREEIAALLSEG